jgi:hypothetical protein
MFLEGDVIENPNTGEQKSVSRTGELDRLTDGASPLESGIKSVLKTASLEFKDGFKGFANTIQTTIGDLLSLDNAFERLAYLDEQSAKINKALGLGSQKAGEFRDLIVEASSKYTRLGLKMDDIAKDYVALSNTFGTNISVTDETMAELAATSVVTGAKVETLAPAFRSVGVEISGIAPRMMEVTKIAKESGVIVGQVAGLVVKNIEKLNLYNFDGGIKGLAKMSAQATKLGISMDEVFKAVDKTFNPEGAIETAAALQRLGVSASALIDPLNLMDMSANDPTEYSNQIVKMTKDFVKFNKDLGEFQILPGEKRRLREVAEALGMSAGELAKMGINAANLEYKMKQIKFSTNMPKEDRELIATMSQLNKQGIAEVKVKQFAYNKDTGEEEWTGRYEMVDANKISAKQLTALRESQELQGATMEEIAIKQQGELESLNNTANSILQAVAYGAAGSAAFQSAYTTMTTGARKTLFEDENAMFGSKEIKQAEYWREATEKVTGKIGEGVKYVIDTVSQIKDLSSAWDALKDLGTKATELITNFSTNAESFLNELGNVKLEVKKENQSMGDYELMKSNYETKTTVNSNLTSANINNATTETNTIASSAVNLNNTVDVTVKLDESSKNQMLTQIFTDAIVAHFSNQSNMSRFIKDVEKFKTSNGNVLSNVA